MSMFCFQCEQTAFQKGCTKVGVCGKKDHTSNKQDELISAIINLAQEEEKSDENTKLIIESLFSCVTNVNFDDCSIEKLIEKANSKIKIKDDFKVSSIWEMDSDTRSLKSLILFGIKGMAAYAYHAWALGYKDEEINEFFYYALEKIAKEDNLEELLDCVLKTGKINFKCLELLDRANRETFGEPRPNKVTTKIEKGPFIVVSGHDYLDLEKLLEQTKDKGINIYTHGELLPAHSYPKLSSYPHLKGNFGSAWQNQQKEFDKIPAPILFTTNCLMPPKESYIDRVFTVGLVNYPNTNHIKSHNDYSKIIEKSLELKGYDEEHITKGENGGVELTVGFSHGEILKHAPKIIELIKEGKIKHIFLIGGCDGARPGRNYYTKLAKLTPKDTLILTLACGKYRFNDLDLGDIEGIPRILDMGQCNDAYSAINVAFELAKAFNCDINELPLSIILSWYEQKAVCVLLSLLSLGFKNMKLGPSMPAFVSENVLKILQEKYNITPITTPEKDLEEILK